MGNLVGGGRWQLCCLSLLFLLFSHRPEGTHAFTTKQQRVQSLPRKRLQRHQNPGRIKPSSSSPTAAGGCASATQHFMTLEQGRGDDIFGRAQLVLAHHEHSHLATPTDASLLDTITHSPVFWSLNVMLVIIGLLYSWEQAVEYAKEKTPRAIVPVIEQILGEMGGLGFIGLFVSAVLSQAALGDVVGQVSEEFLGEADILLETFEFIHEVFFQSAIAFFVAAAFIIVRVLWSFQTVIELTNACGLNNGVVGADTDDDTNNNNDGGQDKPNNNNQKNDSFVSTKVAGMLTNTPSMSRAAFQVGEGLDENAPETVINMEEALIREFDETQDPFWRELFLSRQERGAETLVIRERLKFEFGLPDSYKIYDYLEGHFASAQLDIVEVSPLSWLPLVPIIALASAVDMIHEVTNPMASLADAAESSGFFFSTPWFFYPKLATEAVSISWGIWNFYKIANIKAMLVPKVVRLEEDQETGMAKLLRPDIERPEVREEFVAKSSPSFLIAPVEELYAAPPENRVQELFGSVGGNGLKFYLNSIKYQTWLAVSSLVVFTSQILPRDLYALTHLDSVHVGNVDSLVPEIITFSALAAMSVAQLSLTPIVFLNYCLIACVENNVRTMTPAVENSGAENLAMPLPSSNATESALAN